MTLHLGYFNHEDGSGDIAIGDVKGDKAETVVRFPEGSGEKEVEHDVPIGTGGGEFQPQQ